MCENEDINVYIPIDLDEKTTKLFEDLKKYGYDLFNPNDTFYQDICSQYTTENGTDIILSDRRKYFFNDTETACQEGCDYSEYNSETKFLKCKCSLQENNIDINPEKKTNFNTKMFFTSFYDVLKYSNILVLKCYKLVFSYKGESENYGNILMLGFIFLYLIFNIIFIIKGYFQLKAITGKIIFNKNNNINNSVEIKDKNNNGQKNEEKNNVLIPPRRKSKDSEYKLKLEIKDDLSSENKINNENLDFAYSPNNTSNDNTSKKMPIIKENNEKIPAKTPNPFIKREGEKSKTTKLKIKKFKLNKKKVRNSIGKMSNSEFNRNIMINSSNNIINNDIENKIENNINIDINNENNNNDKVNSYDLKNVIISNNSFGDNIVIKNNINDVLVFNKNDKKEKIANKKSCLFNLCISGNNFSDFELNELEYNEAVIYDNRSFLQFYWQLIRREHLIIFTFFVKDDYNIISIKLSLFIFLIVLDFGLNIFFFVDDSMNKIYLDYGKYNFIIQIPQIVYSTMISEAIDILLRYLCLTEKDIYRIKKIAKKKDKDIYKYQILKIFNCIKIKLLIYYIISFILMIFFWYFACAFCAVYKNTQNVLIKDLFFSFFLSLLYPFGLYILPASLRILSLKDKKMRLNIFYKLSDIIPFI